MATTGGASTAGQREVGDPPAPLPCEGDIVAGRYRVVRRLGRGGMAVVVEVEDLSTQQRLALKRLRASERAKPAQAELFELEYHTLSQLRHPAIVRAHEFGRDEQGPFYTMELLDGGELRGLAPLPWRKVCDLLIDICSALSLVHSRRLVHRDVTIRNVHCTRAGDARLIDFGAMTVFGPCTEVVGTPPFCAPEIFGLQVVDARTDLYALGAVAYHALTGRQAYGARSFPALHRAWLTQPRPPSSFKPEIPAQLDQLVMSMLSLQAVARPRSAVEIMQRLATIAQRELPHSADVSRSYLTTPTLVGRKSELMAVRRAITRAANARGGAVLVSATAGLGQSRFIDACVLEAKLVGAIALRTGQIAEGRPWSGIRELLHQLRTSLGSEWGSPCDSVDVVEGIWPDLVDGTPLSTPAEPIAEDERASVIAHAQGLLLWAARTRTLVVAIDDMQALDEPSAALVASLAREAEGQRVLVLAGVDPKVASRVDNAITVVRRAATSVRLHPLSARDTRELLGSVFDSVPHLDVVSDALFRASAGVPRSVMRLAQHLVDVGKIAFSDGAFVLPTQLDPAELPADERAAMQLRAANLGPRARHLAEAIALHPDASLPLATTVAIAAETDRRRHLRALDELLSAGLLAVRGHRYSLLDRDMRAALVAGIAPEQERAHCLRIAQEYGRRVGDYPLEIHFLMRAGHVDQALDRLLSQLDGIGAQRDVGSRLASKLMSLPRDWHGTYRTLLEHCKRSSRPRRDVFRVRAHLVATGTLQGAPIGDEIMALLEQLAVDSGLDICLELEQKQPPDECVTRALAMAQERYEATSADARVLPPKVAVPTLARSVSLAIAYFADSYDRKLLGGLPDLGPLAPISPALELIRQNQRNSIDYRVGRLEQARAGFLAMARRLEEPDRCGLDPHAQTYIRLSILFAAAMIDVTMERDSCLSLAAHIEHDPLFRVHAARIRLLHAIAHGDSRGAERYERQVELFTVKNTPQRMFVGTNLWLELQVRIACDELLRVQELLPEVRQMVQRFESWRPILHLALASYQRIRGDHATALAEIERALPLVEAGQHGAWHGVAATHVQLLVLARESEAARDAAESYLRAADAARLSFAKLALDLGLSAALAELGEYARAAELADGVIAARRAISTNGVSLAFAHETRARVALAMGDQKGFAEQAKTCAELYCSGGSPALAAKYDRLVHDARVQGLRANSLLPISLEGEPDAISSGLSQCRGGKERMQHALDVILQRSRAAAGFLYVRSPEGPRLVAHSPGCLPGADADAFARKLLDWESRLRDANLTTATANGASERDTRWLDEDGTPFVGYLLEHNHESTPLVTGVVMLQRPDELDVIGLGTVLPAVSEALHNAGDVSLACADG